mmetsp:Transcript_22792/g.53174  ORF Transcript_22792/g.53174 Transcript_22792/m.53174 type:complete len:297 (-) Transcript_22792:1293-2183(-)
MSRGRDSTRSRTECAHLTMPTHAAVCPGAAGPTPLMRASMRERRAASAAWSARGVVVGGKCVMKDRSAGRMPLDSTSKADTGCATAAASSSTAALGVTAGGESAWEPCEHSMSIPSSSSPSAPTGAEASSPCGRAPAAARRAAAASTRATAEAEGAVAVEADMGERTWTAAAWPASSPPPLAIEATANSTPCLCSSSVKLPGALRRSEVVKASAGRTNAASDGFASKQAMNSGSAHSDTVCSRSAPSETSTICTIAAKRFSRCWEKTEAWQHRRRVGSNPRNSTAPATHAPSPDSV